MNNKNKTTKKKIIKSRLIEREDFLIHRLKEEWSAAERSLKKHELIQEAKRAGVYLTKTMLKLLAIVGMITVAAIAPNMFVAFDKLNRHKKFFSAKNLNNLYRAKDYQYIKMHRENNRTYTLSLTEKGRFKVSMELLNHLNIKKPKKWDNTWWLVVFDIPRKHNTVRNALRQRLKNLGMRQLQASVFISPYSCKEEVEFLSYLYNATDFVHVINAKYISNFPKMQEADFF